MLDTIYVGLTGLTTFSGGLKTISNNVANMNTVGYKARQTQFADLYYRFQTGADGGSNATPYTNGSGVTSGGEYVNSKQGELRTTGNDLDVGINGRGYFILQGEEGEVYTRAGQFEADNEGFLVARGSKQRLLFLDQNGDLQTININDHGLSQAKATQQVKFNKTLNVNDTPSAPYSVNVTALDSLGGSHTLVVKFTKHATTPRNWSVEVSEGGNVLHTGAVQFEGAGKVSAGFESFAFNYKPSDSVDAASLTLDFNDATALSTTASDLAVLSQDGFGVGALLKTTFDADGAVIFGYSNEQKVTGPRLALANFSFDSALEPIGTNLFVNSTGQQRMLGRANESVFGKITGGSIEASNVDLADQFSELIITQRGYQASSQVITTANEMIQQLFDMRKR
jgi:flagellar hook protein FlgE